MQIRVKTSFLNYFILFLLLAISTATYLVYKDGLNGSFIFDDGPAISQNTRIAIDNLQPETLLQAAFSSSSGPLGRPLSMLSFALNYYFTGLHPYYFKLTNLAIHVVNGIGIFFLSLFLLIIYQKRFEQTLSRSSINWISLAVSAAWLLHPFNLTSVLYIVQRMTSLSALFCIWGLVVYCWGRIRLYDGDNRGGVLILISLAIFTPLAALSKENGLILPLLMLIAELSLFNFQAARPAARRFVLFFFIVTVAIPAVLALGYIAVKPDWILGGYAGKTFTLSERVMTEARVIWFYIRLIILPSIGQMGLYHDYIVNSRSLFEPVTTIFSILGILALLGLAFFARKRAPLITFGLLFFFAGHLLESTVISLEIAHEHRNYLPMYGLILILFYYLLSALFSMKTLRMRQFVAVALIALFAFSTHARANYWSDPITFVESEVARHPDSARNNGEMAHIYASIDSDDPATKEINYLTARYHYEKATSLDPNYTHGLVGLIILSSTKNRPVEADWIAELKRRLEHTPFTAEKSNQLVGLATCQANGICKLANQEIESILRAPLRNLTLTSQNRAGVLSALSLYLVNIERDYPAAVTAMRQMADAAPQELEYRMTLIKFLNALGRHEEAKTQLNILSNLDSRRVYTKEIAEQTTLLKQSN